MIFISFSLNFLLNRFKYFPADLIELFFFHASYKLPVSFRYDIHRLLVTR